MAATTKQPTIAQPTTLVATASTSAFVAKSDVHETAAATTTTAAAAATNAIRQLWLTAAAHGATVDDTATAQSISLQSTSAAAKFQ